MAYTTTYDYMYNVVRGADGSFQLEAGSPAATAVNFNSAMQNVNPGGQGHIAGAGNALNGHYDYVGSLTTSEGGTGYIVYDAADQQYYMLTDTQFNFAGSPDLALGALDSTITPQPSSGPQPKTYTATYNNMYNVVRETDGSFRLELGNAAATAVNFSSNQQDINAGAKIHITNAGNGLSGGYDYIGSLTTSEGGAGYIVYNAADQQYYMLTDSKFIFAGHPDLSLGTAASTGGGSELPVCYMAGTRIATPEGEKRVEDLKPGDLVLTADHRAIAVRWLGRQTVAPLFAGEFALPVRIKAGALGENMPSRDLLVSHAHALFVDGVLVQAGALVNGTSIVRENNVPKTFVYYHVEVDDHSLILAENTPAETFVDNVERVRFDNWHEYEALYPEGKKVAELSYPRAKAARQVPSALRARIAERAGIVAAAEVSSAA